MPSASAGCNTRLTTLSKRTSNGSARILNRASLNTRLCSRKAAPYAAYDQYKFEIPVGTTGDTYDRYLVRMEEMRQSRLICLQAIENIPAGPIMAKVGKVLKPPPGEVYHAIEAPKGEIGYYIVSDGTV